MLLIRISVHLHCQKFVPKSNYIDINVYIFIIYVEKIDIVDSGAPKMAFWRMTSLPPKELIRGIRAIAGLSQDQFALLAGLSGQTLFRIEKGKVLVGGSTMQKIETAMKEIGLEFIYPDGKRGWGVRYSSEN